ncbi:ligand-binding sensor domain-containing protein [Mucilaginibacter sp.]|uniref:ligand-binding sensor domain-containing protein n=1 Tax=Mucilaginibacter sp. TaxID=1882438 RepID=UPI003D0CA024
MKNYSSIYALLLTLVFCTPCRGQVKTDLPKDNIKAGARSVINSAGPSQIARNIIQDKKGNIWVAAFDGIFRYDGKTFTNITSKVSSARFFSVLEDGNGNLWFGSIGSGVYYYDGKSFKNFTTRDGLAGNDVTCIYEDKAGNIWFGTGGGASRYDGKSFRNFTTKSGLSDNDINLIIEDKTGKFWFGTRGNACFYDGKKFTVFTYKGKPFTNVRSIIEDKKGNIWLGGFDGLWRCNGSTFTNFSRNFVGYIYEDKKGNIWTSSEKANGQDWALYRFDEKALNGFVSAKSQWALSRYDERSLSNKKPTVTEIKPNHGMICGILEANDGRIWFGASDGVYCYDGSNIASFNRKKK